MVPFILLERFYVSLSKVHSDARKMTLRDSIIVLGVKLAGSYWILIWRIRENSQGFMLTFPSDIVRCISSRSFSCCIISFSSFRNFSVCFLVAFNLDDFFACLNFWDFSVAFTINSSVANWVFFGLSWSLFCSFSLFVRFFIRLLKV